MGISIGMVGLGEFGACFADLFKAHPLVDRIAFCDREVERAKRFADDPFMKSKLNSVPVYDSLDAICESDLDALVIITQQWLHAPQAIQAMKAGKDVYTAVPIICVPDDDEILDCIDTIIDVSRKTGKHYMLGETTCFRPQTQFCRRKVQEGAFGDFVYAEGEYTHDVDCGCSLRNVRAMRAASKAGMEGDAIMQAYYDRGLISGPMHYPTHSCSGPVFVMNTYAKKVTAYGTFNKTNDPFFAHQFSNEFAFFKMANGSIVRIAETREAPGMLGTVDAEMFRIMGTKGTFSENRWIETVRPEQSYLEKFETLPPSQEKKMWFERNEENTKPYKLTEKWTHLEDKDMFDPLPQEVELAFKQAYDKNADIEKLKDTDFKPTGHGGSHPYLVNEFVNTVYEKRQSVINPWLAGRFMAMGVMAHKSALKDGETLDVPDWGEPQD